MAACYFLGAKKIISKKNGREFYPATFLTRNNFGDWQTVTRFCSEQSVFDALIIACTVGDPVVVSLDMNGNVLQCVPHESVPALELDVESI